MKRDDEILLHLLRTEQKRIHTIVQMQDQRLDMLSERILEKTAEDKKVEEPIAYAAPKTATSEMPRSMTPAPSDTELKESHKLPKAEDTSPLHVAKPAAPVFIKSEQKQPVPHPKPESSSLEIEFGRVWLVRIGIVVLLTGLVFLGNLAYQHIVPRLGSGMKLSLIVAAGVSLAGIGFRLEKKKEHMRNYARVLMAGGFAAIYYACYAAHFVSFLRVIESAVLGGVLLLALAGGLAWFAHRRRSELLATLVILLSYYTSCINPVGGFTLFSNVLLTATAVFFLVKNRWSAVSSFSLAATYTSYAYWRYFAADNPVLSGDLWIQVAFLTCYWLLFTAAVFLAEQTAMGKGARTSFATGNNGAFFALTALTLSTNGSQKFWLFSLCFGVVLFVLSKIAARRNPDDRTLDAAYLTQALALTTTGLAMRFTGPQLALTLAAQGTVLLSCGRARQAVLLEFGGLLSTAGAFMLALNNLLVGGPHATATAGIVALTLLFNTWWFKRQRGISLMEFHAISTAFAITGFILGGVWMTRIAGGYFECWAVIAALGFAFVPLVELSFISQALFPLAVLKWGALAVFGRTVPVPDTVLMLACGMALSYWWSRNERLYLSLRKTAEGIAAFSTMLVAMIWLKLEFPNEQAMTVTAVVGLLWIGVAHYTRVQMLLFAGLAFSGATIADFVIWQSESHWALALIPIAHVVIVGRWFKQGSFPTFKNSLVALMLLFWSWAHIPSEWLALFYATTSASFALAGARMKNGIFSQIALAIGGLATLVYWSQFTRPGGLLNLIALLVFAVACRYSRRLWPEEPMIGASPTISWSTLLGLFGYVTQHSQFLGLTVGWSFLALGFFVAGLCLRDRHYRVGGLALLGISLARVFFVDVWEFDPVYRILSFIALGVVLLLVGYGYNRFEEKLRRWL